MKIVLLFILCVAFKSSAAQDSSWIMKIQLQKKIALKSFNNLPPIVFNKSTKYYIADSSGILFKNYSYPISIKAEDKTHKEFTDYRNEQPIFYINKAFLIKKPELTPGQSTLNTVGGIVGGILSGLLTDYSQQNRMVH